MIITRNHSIGYVIPRNRLYRDMLEFFDLSDSEVCRVGVYKVDWAGDAPYWHWWCPGCTKKTWHTGMDNGGGWGKSWEWAMQEAWRHVREAAHACTDEQVGTDQGF